MKLKILLCVLFAVLSAPAQTNAPAPTADIIKQAAEKNDAEAQFKLGNRYADGQGVKTNYMEAVKWWRKAAEQNYAPAENSLGFCYDDGKGVAKNKSEAVKWYRKAAEQNYAKAQYNLGSCYGQGQGVAKDDIEAVKWCRKAAEQNYATAQYALGVCYQNGEGVVKDEVEAVKWYRKATEQNYAEAQHNLSVCYENGAGVPKDYLQAYKWMRLASAQGDKEAERDLPRLEHFMTPEELAEALPAPSLKNVNSIAQAKQVATAQLNKYFKTKWSEVDEQTTFSLKERPSSDDNIEFDVFCVVSEKNPIPDTIHLHITSRSKDWRFLDYSRFAIKYDSEKREFDKLEDKGDVVNGGVLEQMFALFSLTEFRGMAWANFVGVKIGSYEYEFSPKNRVEWKVLCQYFDAIKAEKNVSPEEWNDAKQLVEKRRQEKRQEAQTKVLKYYQDLADKGDAYGQFRLGQLYLAGDGVEKNEAKAREFFTKSAAQENKDAAAALEKLNHAKP